MLRRWTGCWGRRRARRRSGWDLGAIDWEATERQRFTLEGTGAQVELAGGGLTRVSEKYGTNSFGSSEASEELLLGRWEAFLTPNLLAVTQGSVGADYSERARGDAFALMSRRFSAPTPGGSCRRSRWTIATASPSAIRRALARAAIRTSGCYQAQETVDWVRGEACW
jgi:hypothetical protein